jgi:predicted Rossmann fold flavoprotein
VAIRLIMLVEVMSHMETDKTDCIIIGAGAAGLMAASSLCTRKKKTIVIESNKSAGRKILISGGGRCNFTNLDVEANHYVSENPHFCKSALKQYTNWDFIDLVANAGISYHEKTLGQLFCDKSSSQILELLLAQLNDYATLKYSESVIEVSRISEEEQMYEVRTSKATYHAPSVIVASGGLSLPSIGASPIGHQIAKKFGHKLIETSPALVPFTLDGHDLNKAVELSGVSLESIIKVGKTSFCENILFTHKGLSGPAILKASLYWHPGEMVTINFLPKANIEDIINSSPKKKLRNTLKEVLPERFIEVWLGPVTNLDKNGAEIGKKQLQLITNLTHNWEFKPKGTEGYRKAEVTRGGVATDMISSKTMESKLSPGLFFVGEVIDVTGLLGGYNFQWAWSSGFIAGNNA